MQHQKGKGRLGRRITPNKIRHLLGRLGVALVLMTFGAWEILRPASWANYMPPFLGAVGSILTLVTIHGIVLMFVGLAVLLGVYLRLFAIAAVLLLLAIIVTLIWMAGYPDIVVRDTGILLLALTVVFDNERYLTLTRRQHWLLM